MSVLTKIGLKVSEPKIPTNRQSIQTGKFAPATLTTGLHPAIENRATERMIMANRNLGRFPFGAPTTLPAYVIKRITQRRARNLQQSLKWPIQFQDQKNGACD